LGSLFVDVGVSSLTGLMCSGPGCAEGVESCTDGAAGMGAGEGDVDWIAGVAGRIEEVNSS